MSEALVGAVYGGCGICFAPSGDGSCTVDPKFQPSWVLYCFHGDRLGVEYGAIGGEHEWSVLVQSGDRSDESLVSDGMVCRFGPTVSVGIAEVPLGTDGKPEEGDELPSPDITSPVPAVEFELRVVGRQEIFL
jgi:hypothetical protein